MRFMKVRDRQVPLSLLESSLWSLRKMERVMQDSSWGRGQLKALASLIKSSLGHTPLLVSPALCGALQLGGLRTHRK